MRDASLALLYPRECRVCGAPVESWRDGVACAQCWQNLDEACRSSGFCSKCGLLLPALPAHPNLTERRCGRCDEMSFTCARSCGAYEGALRESVIWLKERPQLAPRLRELLHSAFVAITGIQAVESIIPVPLHPRRQQSRGFNQAEVIARALSAATGPDVDAASLIRRKETDLHRAGMDSAARAKSLQNAFEVRAPRLIENCAVLVVDDVMTTGSTLHEIADTLLAGGARAVSVLTIARAVSLFH
ncbi:MAG TPA: ComF family protein [Blastocatellia bacterium]|nr:ComF family protein [Blastocatellia bacterium]